MLDVRATTIIYQAQVYYTNLINSLAATKSLGKERADDWRKADLILGYLQTWNYEVNLTTDQDTTNYNYILYALLQLCGIVSFPVGSPLSLQAPTYLLQGPPGTSTTGPIGPRGFTGLATDFNAGPSTTSILVDSFLITDAKAARWDYLISGIANASRAGSVIGHWTPDGAATESADTADNDLISTTDGIEFDIQYSGGTIFLIAIITSGTWTISGSRYFIPNNGNGTGPISGLLPNGQIYVGNTLNLAQAQIASGAFTLSNTGVATLSNSVVFDANINASAAISLSKLAPLTANQIVVTDGFGVLTTISTPTPTNLAFFDITSSLTALLNAKLTDPTTSVGDLLFRNGSNIISRLAAGSANQVLTIIGGLPTWQTPVAGFADPMTSVGDIMIRNGGNITSRLGIGSSNQVLTVSGGVPVWATPSATGVTSVGVTQPTAGFTITGTNPITSTGTFTFALSDDLAGVEGLVTTGIVRRTAPNTWLAGSTVTIAEGGTNITNYVTGDLLYSPSTNTLGRIGIGSTNQVLTVVGGVPTWTTQTLTAAGSDTQVQFNNSGVLGASSNLIWDGTFLKVGSTSPVWITGITGVITGADGYFLRVKGGDGVVSTPTGFNLELQGGPGYFSGGGNNSGGDVLITGGAPHNAGLLGNITLTATKLNLVLGKELQLNSSAGTSGQYLKSQGAGSPPVWGTLPASPTFTTYTPTVTSVQNISSLTTHTFYYRTNGTSVEVWGTVNVQATTSGSDGNVAFTVSSPSGFTISFSNNYDVIGVMGGVFNSSGLGTATGPVSGIIEAVPSSTNMQCVFTSKNPANTYTIKIYAIYSL